MIIELALLPWPCAICDASGVLREANALWQRRFGAHGELEACLPEAHQHLQRHLRDVAPAESGALGAVFDCSVRAPGELAPLILRFAALDKTSDAPEPDAPEKLWLIAQSVGEAAAQSESSERENAERAMDGVALRLQARNWRAFFRDAAAGKALIGLEGETIEVNRALCDLTGYTDDQLLNGHARDIRHPDDHERVTQCYESILAGGPPIAGIEARYLHCDGHYLTCLLSLSLIRDSRERPLYFTAEVEDITARRDAEARLLAQSHELERANLELLRSNADLERFAFVASHDLQEPLRKIRVFGDRLRDLAAHCDPSGDFERYLEVMTRSAGRMQNLIDDLLAYGRLQNRARAFVPVDLNQLWDQLREEFADELRERGASLDVGALPTVHGNASRLRQLFANLFSNALKFRGPEPLRITVRATPRPATDAMGATDATDATDAADAMVDIEVSDNGVGFEQADADSVFEVFTRLHSREQFPGTGIGLAICRRVAREHGGDLLAYSAPGQGARFIATLAL